MPEVTLNTCALCHMPQHGYGVCSDCVDEHRRLRRQNIRLRAALIEIDIASAYMHHAHDCTFPGSECDCGLHTIRDIAMKAIDESSIT